MWEEDIVFQHSNAAGIAIKLNYCGKGAERVVYRMTEVNSRQEPVGLPLVAKCSLYEEDNTCINNNPYKFHQVFIRTQNKAANFTKKFTSRLSMIPSKRAKNLPLIQFLDCTVYSYSTVSHTSGAAASSNFASVLCERRLDTRKYKKWNDNNGGVFGISKDVDCLAKLTEKELYTIKEDEEDDDDDDEEECEDDKDDEAIIDSDVEQLFDRIIEEIDIPQAFSHWTYRFSRREHLVCDLQGVFDKRANPNVFVFTDPCIHTMRKKSFGPTSRGRQGMNAFFKSHECNALCELLGLLRYKPVTS